MRRARGWFKQRSMLGKAVVGLVVAVALLCSCAAVISLLSGSVPPASPAATVAPPTEAPVLPTSTPLPTASPTVTPMVIVVPAYDVVELEDISMRGNVRYRVKVTVEFPVSAEQVRVLCKQIVEGLKDRTKLNAVVVFVYDTRSLVSDGYSVARCEYAPGGVWADAGTVTTGNYSTHRFVYEYQPKVDDPQAALAGRPTEEELGLYRQWNQVSFELISGSDDAMAAETEAFEQVADENGVAVQAVRDAVNKCIFWMWR